MHFPRKLVGALTLLSLVAAEAVVSSAAEPAPIPVTPKIPVVEVYHGVKVTDDYRWLEDGSDPAVRQWSEAENAHARAMLDHLPSIGDIRGRVAELETAPYVNYGGLESRPGMLFAMKLQPPKQQPFLVVMKSADDLSSERVVLDPNELDPGGTTAIDFYVPSRDGRLVAVSLSHGGSESGDAHLYETATGRETGEVIPRVNGGTAGGSVAWNEDGTGFFYTRYPRGTERPPDDLGFYQEVYFHRLGTKTEEDRYELGRGFPKIAEIALEASEDGRIILAKVANGDGGEFAHYVRSTGGQWTQVTRFEDQVVQAALGPDQGLYLLSRAAAPHGKLLRVPLTAPELARAVTVVPPGDGVIDAFLPTAARVFVIEQAGGPSELKVFNHAGTALPSVSILPVSSVTGLTRLAGDDILYNNASYVRPSAWYRFDAQTATIHRTALRNTNPVSFDDCEVSREFAVSKDGTRIPLTVIRPKGLKIDRATPALLYAYGGYGVSVTPGFAAIRRIWLDQGGIWVVANIRGGGEYGEEWHRAGNLTKKHNVFDDFTAAMEYLVAKGYTSRDRLAIMGGSNGGLLMGAVYTQHPDRFKVCVSFVGIYDMLRVELSPNGAFNVTEFGTVKDPTQFPALYAYSPYHHVVDGTRYPPVLFLTGANDPRVEPWQSRKMTARLQAADPRATVLLRTSTNAGHGIGSSLRERMEEDVDVYAFLFAELGVTFKRGASVP